MRFELLNIIERGVACSSTATHVRTPNFIQARDTLEGIPEGRWLSPDE